MPNTGHITLCPYYVNEREKTISCEDVGRRFRSKKERMDYMNQYCDKDYMQCKYAQALEKLYEVMEEKGEDHMLEFFKQRNRAARVELKRTVTQLGRQEAKTAKMAEEIKELKAENMALKESIEVIRKKNKEMFGKWQGERAETKAKEVELFRELQNLTAIYEAYIVYLMHQSGEMKLYLDEFHKWHDDYDYILKAEDDNKSFIAEVKEKEDGDNRSSGEIPDAGTEKTEQTEESAETSGKERE